MSAFRRSSGSAMGRLTAAAMLAAALLLQIAAARADGLPQLQAKALELVNKSRKDHNLPPLTLEAKLNKAAQGHASDMLKRNYYGHNSPEGKTVGDRFLQAGGNKWLMAAENIAKFERSPPPITENFLKHLQEAWMNSPGHRVNILHKGVTQFGFGIAVDARGELYAVQNFAGPGTSSAAPGSAQAKPVGQKEQAALALEAINAERKKAGRAALKSSDALNTAAQGLLPAKGEAEFSLEKKNIWNLIPAEDGQSWNSIGLLAALCGGCGVQPVAADISYFIGQFTGEKKQRALLLDAKTTHLGFAMTADGEGKKVAVGVLGDRKGR